MKGVDLSGRVAIITGAASGIGAAYGRGFAEAGAQVALLDVEVSGVECLARELGSERAFGRRCDISDWQDCEHAVAETVHRFGTVHILINNAALGMGAIRPDHIPRPVTIEEISPQCWASFMAVNLSGAFHMTRAALPYLREQRWGRIINITTSFFTMLRAGFAPYGPAKAGLEAWSSGLAKELRESGITVNVVVPGGPADTAMHPPESGFNREDLIPPQAMLAPTLWLCSTEADGITDRRYVAARWQSDVPPDEAERYAGAAIGWPDLALDPVWPGGRPKD
jgi:NAD(P)-dependent dehydrogenase (short-subunit alcohol dehydrogenase family)